MEKWKRLYFYGNSGSDGGIELRVHIITIAKLYVGFE